MSKESTTVSEQEIDLDALINQPGADNILIPAGEKKEVKPNLFSRKGPDPLAFLDKEEKEETDPEKIKVAADTAEVKKQADIKAGILNPDGTLKVIPATELNEIINSSEEESEEEKKAGRKTLDKDGLYELTKKLIEKKLIVPFDDEKPLEKYSLADYEELYEANDQDKQAKLEKEVPIQFFDSLPDKLKYAATYVMNGGEDLKGLFRHLAESEAVGELDPTNEQGQETIVRQYLQATKFGNAEEIQEQLDEWKDQSLLEKKATGFKPKLDALQEEYVQAKIQEQEGLRKRQQQQSETYMKNIYQILEPGELNGMKLDKKTQSMLYTGLVQPNYPSISGRNTNLLGHLLEKYQFVEPKHDLIAEVLWHLADPEGFKSNIRVDGKKEATAETLRKLKTEEKNKIASSGTNEEEDPNKPKGLKRPSASTFFKR